MFEDPVVVVVCVTLGKGFIVERVQKERLYPEHKKHLCLILKCSCYHVARQLYCPSYFPLSTYSILVKL